MVLIVRFQTGSQVGAGQAVPFVALPRSVGACDSEKKCWSVQQWSYPRGTGRGSLSVCTLTRTLWAVQECAQQQAKGGPDVPLQTDEIALCARASLTAAPLPVRHPLPGK